jgi:hypothetical protein
MQQQRPPQHTPPLPVHTHTPGAAKIIAAQGHSASFTYPLPLPRTLILKTTKPRIRQAQRIFSLSPFPLTSPPRTPTKMAWQPQQQGLDEVLAMLRQTSSPDSEVQKNITVVS